MSLFERERAIIVSSEYVDNFDFEEVEAFIKEADLSLFIAHAYRQSKGKVLVQPRGGFPTYEKVFSLYEFFKEAGVDILPLTIDSHTRLNDYHSAGKMLALSEENETDMLNGYPLVNHGYRTTRKMMTHFATPVSLRHGTPDARLLVETALASGIFEIEGGPITYLLPYSKNFPLDKAFLYWKYVERVCAHYSTPGREVNRESFGPLTATLVHPAIAVVIQLLEMLLSLEEGVRSFSVSFSQSGSMIQDIVTAAVLKKAAHKYALTLGFEHAQIHLVYHQWMGAFPYHKGYSDALINTSTIIAALIGADKMITKTHDEAFGIPTKEANAAAVANTQYTLRILKGLPSISDEAEEANLARMVDEIMEAVLNDPADTLWRQVFNAIKKGHIDVPFSPHVNNRNELITVRDRRGNIRIAQKGQLPISAQTFGFEQAKLEHLKNEGSIVEKIIHDIGIMQ